MNNDGRVSLRGRWAGAGVIVVDIERYGMDEDRQRVGEGVYFRQFVLDECQVREGGGGVNSERERDGERKKKRHRE